MVRKYRPEFHYPAGVRHEPCAENEGKDTEQDQIKRRFLGEMGEGRERARWIWSWCWDVSQHLRDIKDILMRHAESMAA